MNPLIITQFGNPLLRTKSLSVPQTSFQTPSLKSLVRRMFLTMEKGNGIGLAAPQVGKSLQLFVLHIHATALRPGLESLQPEVVINPVITGKSKNVSSDWEGCLSLPGIFGLVPRHEKINTKYYTLKGNLIEQEYEGLSARVFQHEFDHLLGILFVDRMKDMTSLMTAQEFEGRVLKLQKKNGKRS